MKTMDELLPGLRRTAESLGDCPAGEELARAIELIDEVFNPDGIPTIDCWSAFDDGTDTVEIRAKYSGVWVTFDFHGYGRFEIQASLDEEGEHLEMRQVCRTADGGVDHKPIRLCEGDEISDAQLVQAFRIVEADDNVASVRIADLPSHDVWFWTKDDPGEDDEPYDWDAHVGLSAKTVKALRDIGLDVTFNDCPGYYNEGCLALHYGG